MESQNITHYKYRYKFCPFCGTKLDLFFLKNNEPPRHTCGECGFIDYQDPKLIVNAMIKFNDKIVVLKRAKEPISDKWTFPGGYVDRGETIESAAIRETMEECGITIRIEYLTGLYSYPGTIKMVAIFVASYLSGELIAGDETLEVKLVSLHNIPWNKLAFPSMAEALRDYLAVSTQSCQEMAREKRNIMYPLHKR
jgi:mutator protein MutT